MAMCVMDSYVRKGGYDLKDIADTFVRWFLKGYLSSVDGHSFDVDHATAVAMMAIRCGKLRSVLRVRGDTRKMGYGNQGLQEGRKARGRLRGSHVWEVKQKL